MNIIHEQRESILTDNNNAQTDFVSILNGLKTDVTEINVKIPLQGELDLSILSEKGFERMTTLLFSEGEITGIRNIPTGISKLVCCKNLLVELEDLPGSLLYLNINHNYLTSFDFTKVPYLEELHCDDNKIQEFKNLPSSLTSLYCEQNKLKKLDLKGLKNLKTLHCSNNPLLMIDNLPETIHDFVSENNSFGLVTNIEAENIDGDNDKDSVNIDKKINYMEAIKSYFRLKNKYENELLKKKRTAFKSKSSKKAGSHKASMIKGKCIHCNRPVGTIFSTNENGYAALCGDKINPCKLNIKLVRGDFISNDEMLYIYKGLLERSKTDIIRLKLNTLFSYISEGQSVEKFKEIMEDYNETSETYSEVLKNHNEMYNNEEKKEMIRNKNEMFHDLNRKIRALLAEYENDDNKEILRNAVKIYIHDLLPEIENLRRLKYDIVEMDDNVLFQKEFDISKLDFVYGEQPSVKSFKK